MRRFSITAGAILFLGAVGLMGWGISMQTFDAISTANYEANMHELEMGMASIDVMLDGVKEGGGYRQWTATQIADAYIANIATANSMPPDPELEEMGVTALPEPRIEYVKGAPTGPWQIVLVPNDAANSIRVDAYADDPATPWQTKTVPVSPY